MQIQHSLCVLLCFGVHLLLRKIYGSSNAKYSTMFTSQSLTPCCLVLDTCKNSSVELRGAVELGNHLQGFLSLEVTPLRIHIVI